MKFIDKLYKVGKIFIPTFEIKVKTMKVKYIIKVLNLISNKPKKKTKQMSSSGEVLHL